MRRTAALACLLAAAALLPLQAEAARFRLGGRSSAPAVKTSRGLVVIPGAAAASRSQAASADDKPERVPFPPSSADPDKPVLLRLSTNDENQQSWCRTQVVVGGFCMMN
jgi:hypothetical protein